MRIAIVGAGVSGLVAAHLLHDRHEICVYEAAARPGGHVNTVRVDTGGATHWIDTGFIVFNDRNYPRFVRLLDRLGVATQATEMSFGASDDAGTFAYASTSPNGLFATRSNLVSPRFHRMLRDVVRFQREARDLLVSDDDPSLAEWLERCRFSPAFVERLIVPQAAAVWSADPRQMWSFPARFLAEFFDNHGMLALRGRPRWRAVTSGSHRYVEALVAPFRDRLRLATPVRAIRRHPDHVTISPRGGDPERFDAVVLATHSDQALQMLDDATPREHEVLGAIPYQPNEAVLHTDRRLLPRRRRAWASWNYHLLDAPAGRPTVTYHMNRLQSLRAAGEEFCVTLNRTEAIDPAKIVRRIECAHPVYTSAGRIAQRRRHEISGRRRTHYCGAYWGWGFHEDGVASAVRVAAELGGRDL
jgi:uncharacterized protein